MAYPDGLTQTKQQPAGQEGEKQAPETDMKLRGVDRPASYQVTPLSKDSHLDQQAGCQKDKEREDAKGESVQYHGIQDVRDVLEEKRPGRPIKRMHFTPPPDIHRGWKGHKR